MKTRLPYTILTTVYIVSATWTSRFLLHALGMLRLLNTPYYKATYRYAPSRVVLKKRESVATKNVSGLIGLPHLPEEWGIFLRAQMRAFCLRAPSSSLETVLSKPPKVSWQLQPCCTFAAFMSHYSE